MNAQPAKVLFAAHSGAKGGAELCLDTTLAHLDRRRHCPSALFAWDGPMLDAARQRGVPVEAERFSWWLWIDPKPWYFKNLLLGLARVWRLRNRIRREKIDLVYTNSAAIFESALAARLAGVPHIWHVHEVLTPEHVKPRLLPLGCIKRLIAALSDRVVFESDASRAICRDAVPETKSTRVYNSVRFTNGEMAVDREAARRDLDLAPSQCAAAWVGRFSERKNPMLLIRAVSRMKHAAQATFLFVGGGPLEATMRDEIARHGLQDRCRILPFQDDIRPIMAAADLLVLTSREESFGLVLVEAGACGHPVVATRSQGPVEIVDDGVTGYLVDQDDEAQLADRVDRLAVDADARTTMGRAGARRVDELFSPEKNTRLIQDLIDDVLQARRQNGKQP